MDQSHRLDEAKWRATYGIQYPAAVTEVSAGDAPQEIAGKKVRFPQTKKSLQALRFVTCQFLITPKPGEGAAVEQGQLEISRLTFRGCHFDRTFLGGVAYLNCRFVDCSFSSCDFGGAKFLECEFYDCVFSGCTAWDTLFTRTAIDAAAFMRGQCLPLANFRAAPDAELATARKKFVRTQAALAAQLVASLAVADRAESYDAALYYFKWFEFRHRLGRLGEWGRYRRLNGSRAAAWAAAADDAWRLLFVGTNLALTKGGTSVRRLLLAFVVVNAVLMPLVVMPSMHLGWGGDPLYCQHAGYLRRLLSSVEIFMAFGYGAYAPADAPSHAAIACCALSGLVWYAFLIPVLLRRVYK